MRRTIHIGAVLASLVTASCGGVVGLSTGNDGSPADGAAGDHVPASDAALPDGAQAWPGDTLQADGAIADRASADVASDALPADVAPMDGSPDVDGAMTTIGAGCGQPPPINQTTVPGKPTGYTQYSVMGTGATLSGPQPAKVGPRTFWVRVPANYDPNHKYRVVYLGQGCGGYSVANTATYALYNEKMGGSEQAIYVALDIPRDMARIDCYDDQSGPASQEWEAFELFHSVVDTKYCVDNDNVFVAGYSTGGNLANMWGCYFAGDGQGATPRQFAPKYHIRGQAVVAGVEPDNNPPCNGPVAAIWIHDQQDSAPYAGDRTALARVLRMNGCMGSPTAPWHPEVTGAGTCLQYTACPARYPVVFCTTSGLGHGAQPERAVPAFNLLFDEASGIQTVDGGTD